MKGNICGNESSRGVELPFPWMLFSKHVLALNLAIAKQVAVSENWKECIGVDKYSQEDQQVNSGVEVWPIKSQAGFIY